MADHYSPDEITRIFAEYHAALKQGTSIDENLIKRYKDAQKGVVNYTDTLNASLKQLSRSGLGLVRSLKDGKKGSSVYNDAIGSAADVIVNIASQFGPVGAIFGAIVKAGSEAVKAINQQADDLKDSYQEMSRIGVTGAAGMSGVFSNMQKLGYGIKELGQMTDLLRENSDTLATLGGTAADGANQFADLAGSIQRSDMQVKFREMGIGIDDINRGAMSYMRQQSMIGRGRNMTGDQLRNSTVEYIRQQDIMRKLTGKTQEQQEDALKRAYGEEAFNQTMVELEKEAESANQEEAEAAQNQIAKMNEVMMSKIPDDIKDMMKRAVGGDFGAAEKLAKIAPQTLKKFQDKRVKVGEVMDTLRDELRTARDLRGSQAKYNTFNEDYVDIAATSDFLSAMGDKSYDDIKAEASKQQVVTDKLTKEAVKTETMQLRVRDNLQTMLNKGIIPVTNAIAGLSGLAEKGTGVAAKAIGAAPAGGAPPLGGKPGAPTPTAPAPTAPAPAPVAPPAPTAPTAPPTPAPPPAAPPVKIAPAPPPAAGKAPGAPGKQPEDVKHNLELVKAALIKQGITDPAMIAATLGNVMKETGGKNVTENLAGYKNTSNDRIRKIFGSRAAGKTDEELNEIKADEKKMAEMVYGGGSKIGQGMGNTEPGDGYKYRGRGYIQLTGKNNYREASMAIYGDDRLVKNPDLVSDSAVGADVSAWFMKKNSASMAKRLGMDTANMTQAQANILATSVIAGGDIRKKGAIGEEILGKVNMYAAAQTGNKGYADGGIPTGPQSGYQTALHGTEAVIPMKENKIPLQAKMMAEGLQARSALFEQQLTKITDLIRIAGKQIDVSQKIFQTAH